MLFMCLFAASKFTGECSADLIEYRTMILDRMHESQQGGLNVEKFIMSSLGWNVSLVTAPELAESLCGLLFSGCPELGPKVDLVIDLCLTGIMKFIIIQW